MTSTEFFDLLRTRNAANAARIDALIRADERELTILMSDSSGFSRKTHEFGILQFLAVMIQCYDEVIPLIALNGGTLITHNADNILATFESPDHAVATAIGIHRHLKNRNVGLPPEAQFNVCIGIDHGLVVHLSDNVYGDHVNVAAKVGEDLAQKDEILITASAAARLGAAFVHGYSRSTELGGRTIELHRVEY